MGHEGRLLKKIIADSPMKSGAISALIGYRRTSLYGLYEIEKFGDIIITRLQKCFPDIEVLLGRIDDDEYAMESTNESGSDLQLKKMVIELEGKVNALTIQVAETNKKINLILKFIEIPS